MKKFAAFWKNDWQMKLVSLGIAALLWFFVMAQQNPTRYKEFADIPITYKGVEQLEDYGLCLSDGLDGLVSSVDVTVESSIDVLQFLTEDDITATVDFSDITVAGDYSLKVKVQAKNGNVTDVSPSEVMVTVENLVTRELPVEVKLTGEKDEHLYYGDVEVNTPTVVVSGTQTQVNSFSQAVVYVDVTNVTSNLTESRVVSLLTEDGQIISAEEYDRPLPSVIVTLPVYPTKTFDVDQEAIKANITGVADGYEVTGVDVSDNSIRIAADSEILDTINEISFSKIELDDAIYDTVVQVYPDLPYGVVAAEPEQLTVKVSISKIREKSVFQAIPIEVRNLAEGYNYDIDPENVDVTVYGSREDLDSIQESLVKPYVDLSGLTAGMHEVLIKFDTIQGVDVSFEPGVVDAVVQLSKIK